MVLDKEYVIRELEAGREIKLQLMDSQGFVDNHHKNEKLIHLNEFVLTNLKTNNDVVVVSLRISIDEGEYSGIKRDGNFIYFEELKYFELKYPPKKILLDRIYRSFLDGDIRDVGFDDTSICFQTLKYTNVEFYDIHESPNKFLYRSRSGFDLVEVTLKEALEAVDFSVNGEFVIRREIDVLRTTNSSLIKTKNGEIIKGDWKPLKDARLYKLEIGDSAMDLLMFILDGAFVDNEGNDE